MTNTGAGRAFGSVPYAARARSNDRSDSRARAGVSRDVAGAVASAARFARSRSVASRRALRARLRRAVVSRSAARASSFEGEGGFWETRGAVDASSVAGVRRRVSGTGAAGPGRPPSPASFPPNSRNSRNSRGARWGVIAASRAARLAEALPPPYEVDHAGVAGVAADSSAGAASAPRARDRDPKAETFFCLSLVRDARFAFPPGTDDAFVLTDAPYARSAAATRSAIASRLSRSRSRAAAARRTGVPRNAPASSPRARSSQSVPGVFHAALARLRTSAIAARPAGVEAGVGSPNRARRGGDGETRDASLPTSNAPTGLADATRSKGVRRSSSAAAFNRRACASGDWRTTCADGFVVDVAGPDARGVASRSQSSSAAATRFSVSRRESSGPTTGALDAEGSASRLTPRGRVPACAFARARDSCRRTCLSLYGEASSASLARSDTFNNLEAGVVNNWTSTEWDPEASLASCAEVVLPRPGGASSPESIEAAACALRRTPHLRRFRATAERGAMCRRREGRVFSSEERKTRCVFFSFSRKITFSCFYDCMCC